jgi:hypothetical protein
MAGMSLPFSFNVADTTISLQEMPEIIGWENDFLRRVF